MIFSLSKSEHVVQESLQVLPRSFFSRPTVDVARNLLGKQLIRRIKGRFLAGVIVEVEAYLGEHDPAAHASFGKTNRTEVLYGNPGHAYVFRIHGQHCLNATVEPVGKPGCVLVRAVEPIKGISDMYRYRRRPRVIERELTNGPGKLCQSFVINLSLNGTDMTSPKSRLFITDGSRVNFVVGTSNRIGITKAANWRLRFFVKDNPFVSR